MRRGRPLVYARAWPYLMAMPFCLPYLTPRRRYLAIIFCAVLAGVGTYLQAGPALAQQALQTFARDRLTIETANGGRFEFSVELALTPAQQAQGLMYRRSLPGDGGMLFLYDRPWHIAMWMKNTGIPLDMLFLDEAGRVVEIAERTVPFSLETISAASPVFAVLEINGGTAARLGISAGDRVRHKAFAGAP